MPNLKPFSDKNISFSSITPNEKTIDETHPFYEKNIVLTGDLETLTRASAMQKIADVGGIVKSNVSSKTDFLVVGKQDLSVVDSSGMSSKEKKAHDLIKNGKSIQLLNEKEFLELLN